MKAVIYARYSSDRQSEDSISAQIRACKEYAAQHGITIIKEYTDEAISGRESKTQMRQAYQQMLKDTKSHCFDTILIHKYDRVNRSLAEHVALEKRLQAEAGLRNQQGKQSDEGPHVEHVRILQRQLSE